MVWFDESRLDDERALLDADPVLRGLAESGARVRRAAVDASEDLAVGRELARELDRPRAVVLVGPDADLLRLHLEPTGGVPVVVWPAGELPGWVGSLDLVVVLAPAGAPDARTAATASSAVRRGCPVVAVCAPGSPVADHAAGRWSTVLTTRVVDPFAVALLALAHVGGLGLGAGPDVEAVASAMDAVAADCSPYRDTSTNPAKAAAVGLGEHVPAVLAGPGPLGDRAAAEVAAAVRRLTGLPVVAGDEATVLPLVEMTPSRSVFDDPYDDPPGRARPAVLALGGEDVAPDLRTSAQGHGVRVVDLPAPEGLAPLASYAAAVLLGTYTGAYLRLALVDDPR